MKDKIKAIVIPSAGIESENIKRVKTAIEYNQKNNLDVPYIFSGLGPDTNFALGYSILKEERELDFHSEPYDYLMNETKEFFGIDIKSVNSIENILNTFPKGNGAFPKDTNGKYIIMSYKGHLKRFKEIFEILKEKNKISQDVELEYIPVKESINEFLYHMIYEIVARKKLKKSLKNI